MFFFGIIKIDQYDGTPFINMMGNDHNLRSSTIYTIMGCLKDNAISSTLLALMGHDVMFLESWGIQVTIQHVLKLSHGHA